MNENLSDTYRFIHAFLLKHSHTKAARAVQKAVKDSVTLPDEPIDGPLLDEIVKEWQEHRKAEKIKSEAGTEPSSESDSSDDTSDSSNSDSTSSDDSEDEENDATKAKPSKGSQMLSAMSGTSRSSTLEGSTSSQIPKPPAATSSSSESDSDSSEESDSDVKKKQAHTQTTSKDTPAKPAAAKSSIVKKASPASSSSDSDSDSNSSSESSSDESSDEDKVPSKGNNNSQKAISKSKENSSSSSSEDSEEELPPIKKRKVEDSKMVSTQPISGTITETVKETASPTPPDAIQNSGGKRERFGNVKQPHKNNGRFQRVDPTKYAHLVAQDNRYEAKIAPTNDYGQKAHQDLIVTRGAGFRKEKNKKKRGSYRGGEITMQSHSFRFE